MKHLLANIAKSRAAANNAAKGLTLDQLRSAVSNLNKVIAALEKREAKKRDGDLKRLRSVMAEMKLTSEEISKLSAHRAPGKTTQNKPAAKKRGALKGSKVPPKYQIKVGDQLHKWTGRGAHAAGVQRLFREGWLSRKVLSARNGRRVRVALFLNLWRSEWPTKTTHLLYEAKTSSGVPSSATPPASNQIARPHSSLICAGAWLTITMPRSSVICPLRDFCAFSLKTVSPTASVSSIKITSDRFANAVAKNRVELAFQ